MHSFVRSAVFALIGGSLLLAACAPASTATPAAAATSPSAGQETPTTAATMAATDTPAPTQAAAGSIALTGAGATFPYPVYSTWFYNYAFVDPSVKFNYQSIGSGGGIQQITKKTVDFGASDAILTSDQLAAAPSLQMFPMVAGAVVPSYNVSELKDAKPLIFDGSTLANIFLGKITKWNDPAIAALNPGVTLPDKSIVVAHRSDGSGTSFIFTSYLSAVSDEWKTKVGASTSVQWPVGLGGKGNEGVSGLIAQNDGAIGYIELAYAIQNKLAMASMKNQAGTTLQASIETTQNAMSDFSGQMPDTLARLIVNAPGANSWPISGYTYFLVYMNQTDCTKASKIVQFMHWALTSGTKYASDLDYVPLPDAVRTQVFNKLDQLTCNGQPLPTAAQ
jgi:phosphate transport system substrate-binding protein